ncbi:hypothetical protein MVLG_00515 [Microbotryum lychnidis-dioicae p1A1 Lamole]|uniref:Glycosyltransferase family 69 protein n=1 Tax=Microbotryum lychnidis-dioicae (strain p1A1 Lamole / MvSl-1064) TaxID=683840 RepID=U5GZB1_USTV1|nr:hypothetical protein MVLG_00515 [Microbotryum lychnidis-dioicae p1A1 Lamole]|eukprot:KDE09193.1 hypothetical protein MVLG_00515 [Microbotryum lychnidis-dioicae p1A1 Lamole]
MPRVSLNPVQRLVIRVAVVIVTCFSVKWLIWDSKPTTPYGEVAHPAILERITLGSPLSGQPLDTKKYPFLQSRINRDESPDIFDTDIATGINDFWNRFQRPFATNSDTMHLDEQVLRGAVDELLSFNGWAAAACASLTRPFGNKKDDDWSDLAGQGKLYYFALIVHGADHFVVDQLAVIVQLSKQLGAGSIFVSLVDYASSDSTPFLCDIAESIFLLLGISYRIRQVPAMTQDPAAAYYPLEEAYTRNLALEPLIELWERRKVKFSRVIWLKGFTCPNDLLETIRVSEINEAAMVCSMDWKEHNGFFIYNDRWRTRDMDGNLFRGSKSTSPIDEAPPRDAYGGARYTLHLPFQVFCCESGSHVVDPHQSYYHGVTYQSSVQGVFNTTSASDGKTPPKWSEGPCMDSSQVHFCRDMWMVAFRNGIKEEAKRIAHDEKIGKARKVHPFMQDLIAAATASYSPTTNDKVGYPNSGDYLVDETGASPDGKPKASTEGGDGEGDEEDDEEFDEERDAADAEMGLEPEPYDADEGGKGRPIDLAVKIEDEEGAALAAAADVSVAEGETSSDAAPPLPPPPPPAVEGEAGPAVAAPVEVRAKHKRSVSIPSEAHKKRKLSKRRPKSLPNAQFDYAVARILVNPRCVTTYAGVSHIQLALDLFGTGEDKEPQMKKNAQYVLDEWRTPPESFTCQEMRTTGGRTAPKQQRRTGFQQARLLLNGWRPT